MYFGLLPHGFVNKVIASSLSKFVYGAVLKKLLRFEQNIVLENVHLQLFVVLAISTS